MTNNDEEKYSGVNDGIEIDFGHFSSELGHFWCTIVGLCGDFNEWVNACSAIYYYYKLLLFLLLVQRLYCTTETRN